MRRREPSSSNLKPLLRSTSKERGRTTLKMLWTILLLSAGVMAEAAMSPFAPFCVDFATPAYYSPGSIWTSDTRCERYQCRADGSIQVHTCGSLEGCETTQPDLNQKFPECCPGSECNADPVMYSNLHGY